MRFLRLLLPALALTGLGFSERPPKITVRFFSEANARDGTSFSTPIKIGIPPRDAYLQKVPTINERQISSIFPVRADDGTWGCAFKLDNDGRINLEVVSTDHRGSLLVGFVGTPKGNHKAVEIVIDRTVSDGIITIPRGLTEMEMSVLRQEYKVLGGDPGPKMKRTYRLWNPFRKKEAPAPAPAPPTGQ